MADICAVHDLSGVGSCSLTAAISVLSAMGHRVFALPTALLSKQTAFPGYSHLDFTPHLEEYLSGWNALGLSPDLIFSGFLGSDMQPDILTAYIARHPDATVVVDPVMADHGKLYSCFQPDYVRHMKNLCRTAHVLTPNLTEFCFLTGQPADASLPADDTLLEFAHTLEAPRLQWLVITGAESDGQVINAIVDVSAGRVERQPSYHSGVGYSGTGDLFASVVSGSIAWGYSSGRAVELAASFISEVVRAMPNGSDPRFGLRFEPFLRSLMDNQSI